MILITGINGEMGYALARQMYKDKINNIVGLDIKQPSENIKTLLHTNQLGK